MTRSIFHAAGVGFIALALAACSSQSAQPGPAAPVTGIEPPPGVSAASPRPGQPPTATATVGPPIPPQVIVPSPTAPPTPAGGSFATASPVTRPPAASTGPLVAAPPGAVAPAGTPAAGQPPSAITPTAGATSVPPTATPWLPRVREVGDVQIALTRLEQGVTPDGRPVVRLRAELTNRGSRSAFFADLYFKLVTADGQLFDPVVNVDSPDRMRQGPLDVGQTTAGYLWYLVPPGSRVMSVFYDGPTGQTTIPVPD